MSTLAARKLLYASRLPQPSLDLNFLSSVAASGLALDPRITWTRATTGPATYFDSAGVLQTAPANVLFPSSAINSWSVKTDTTVTDNSVASPDGTVNASLCTEGSAGTAQVQTTNFTVPSGSTLTFSVYLRRGNQDILELILSDSGTTNGISAWVNLATGAVLSTSVRGTATGISSSVVAGGGGWSRYVFTCTMPGGSTTSNIATRSATANASATRVANSTYYVWGAQIEVGAAASAYNPTVAAANGAPRYDYDPVTHASLGLLVEETRTNLILQSQFAGTWTVTGATLTANVVASPDGGTTAARLQEDASNGNHFTAQSITKAASSLTYAITAFFKQGAGTRNVQFLIDDGGGTNGVAGTVNPSTGAIVSAIAAIGAGFSGTAFVVTALPNGWYRFTFTVTTNTATTIRAVLFMQSGASTAYQGDNASNVQLYGFQTELGVFPTSYMPSGAASATRPAEGANMTSLGSWFNVNAGTLKIEWDTARFSTAAGVAGGLSAGTFANVAYFANNGWNVIVATVSGSVNGSAVVANNAVNKQVGSYGAAAGSQVSNNGGAVATSATYTSANAPFPWTNLALGVAPWSVATNQIGGHIRRAQYWPQALTALQMQRLAA